MTVEYTYPHHGEDKESLFSIVADAIGDELPQYILDESPGCHVTNWNIIAEHLEVQKFIKWLEETTNAELYNIWGLLYGDQGSVKWHSHKSEFPAYSFVYYINVPENSGPLMFPETKEIILPTEGNCVVFDPNLSHGVPPSNHSGRCALSGNLKI